MRSGGRRVRLEVSNERGVGKCGVVGEGGSRWGRGE